MKKTLIAMAVVASAVVSGSAMAWTANGTGNSVDLSGILTPVAKITPWEVQVGAAVTDLGADIQTGQRTVDIAVNKAIPVLGIRAVNKEFTGSAGISPQIDFGGAVDTSNFQSNIVPLTLSVRDAQHNDIGTMTVDMTVYAESSWRNRDGYFKKTLIASNAGDAFFGGLPKTADRSANKWDQINSIDAEFTAKYTYNNANLTSTSSEYFGDTNATYSGFYGSGVEQGKTIRITLNRAVAGDAPVQWSASLPITVRYQ